jgi:hypothetical protein
LVDEVAEPTHAPSVKPAIALVAGTVNHVEVTREQPGTRRPCPELNVLHIETEKSNSSSTKKASSIDPFYELMFSNISSEEPEKAKAETKNPCQIKRGNIGFQKREREPNNALLQCI